MNDEATGSEATTIADDRQIVGAGTPLAEWRQWPGLSALPAIDAGTLVLAGARAVVVAPHPDDEILGCGALLQQWSALDRELLIVSVTEGTGSHPGSSAWPPERLGQLRPEESRRALSRLGLEGVDVIRLHLTDTRVGEESHELAYRLHRLLRPNDVLVTTWRGDGHPDHEATGRVCAQLADDRGLALIELPIWMWHWAEPGDRRVPWHRARRVAVDDDQLARKRAAMTEHASQCEPDPSMGRPAVLSLPTLARLMQDHEMVQA
ncbi:PIG-L deacetylase family protein [Salinicola acroporae]|uniref:Acetylglucosaminylphosphatidylinositol deacetylase n=1 Tax=Salinicola acroporae TaxID=1541440 RepID=A0ABT6I4B9_9GAMM|nr:PIG-L family deacetylase [Salinicola acroporae]MDH4572524.1 acetylglucosaminylphosphatidylinositol deacetylase [Salinicola acroporae]